VTDRAESGDVYCRIFWFSCAMWILDTRREFCVDGW